MSRREVVVYRVCDMPHKKETKAEATERVILNGHKWEIDLCADCSAGMLSAVMKYADHGTKTGEPTVFDKPRRPTTSVTPAPRPMPEPVVIPQTQREPMPASAERWRLTQHALERMEERGLDMYEVLMTAERPQQSTPSKKDPAAQERFRDGVLVVVKPDTLEVLTCVRLNENRKVG